MLGPEATRIAEIVYVALVIINLLALIVMCAINVKRGNRFADQAAYLPFLIVLCLLGPVGTFSIILALSGWPDR